MVTVKRLLCVLVVSAVNTISGAIQHDNSDTEERPLSPSNESQSEYKHLYAIMRNHRKVKLLCVLENIRQTPNTVHIIVTMNTIKSNLQFMERAQVKFGKNLCVLNSKKGEFNFNHATESAAIYDFITESGITNVIMCAHPKDLKKVLLIL